jgi:hypothetical protein
MQQSLDTFDGNWSKMQINFTRKDCQKLFGYNLNQSKIVFFLFLWTLGQHFFKKLRAHC